MKPPIPTFIAHYPQPSKNGGYYAVLAVLLVVAIIIFVLTVKAQKKDETY